MNYEALTDLTAEQDLIGCMLRDPRDLYLADRLRPEHFSDPRCQKIWEVMETLVQRGETPDNLSVCAALKQENKLEAIGGRLFVTDLVVNSKVLSTTAEQIVKHIIELDMKRRTLRVCHQVSEQIENGSEIHKIILDIQTSLMRVSDDATDNKPVQISQIMRDTFRELLDGHAQKKPPGVYSGFADLDSITTGFKPGNLVILGARPGVGKTAFSFSIGQEAAKQGPVLFCSFEMTNRQLGQRAIASMSEVDHRLLEMGPLNESQIVDINATMDYTDNLPLYVVQTPGYSVMQIQALARRLQYEHSGLSLLIIDYLQLIRTMNIKSDNRNYEIAQITKTLKQLAIQLGCPILLLSQLNRNIDGKPKLSNLRDSGAIEQDADLVLFLHRDAYENGDSDRPDELDVIVAKNRNGALGTATLLFQMDKVRFLEKKSTAIQGYSRYGHQKSA